MSRTMRRRCISICLIAAAGLILLCRLGVVDAQQPSEEPTQPAKTDTQDDGRKNNTDSQDAVREVGPAVIRLLDKDGKPVDLINSIKFEDFRDWQEGNRKKPPPGFSLNFSKIQGAVVGGHADLKLSVDIDLSADGPIQIPLRLQNVFLKSASYQGPGKHSLHYDAQTGYTCWIDAKTKTQHKLQLDIAAPIEQLGDISRLSLALPLDGQIDLTLPIDRVEVVQDQNVSVKSNKPANGGTRLELLAKGNVQIAWRRGKPPGKQPATVLTSSGAVRVTFEGQRHISSDARLKVRSLTGPIDSFIVRLPTGMKHVPLQAPAGPRRYGVYVLSDQEKRQRKLPPRYANAELVEVRLASKTSDPVEVDLRGRLSASDSDTVPLVGPVEAAGFEVLQAERRLQWGTIDVALQPDWSLRWTENKLVPRVGDFPDALREGGVVARFEYSEQPCSLRLRVLPKATRVAIDPRYLIVVSEDEARLEARLKYKLSGSRPYPLRIDLPGWRIDEVLPANLAPADFDNQQQGEALNLSLTPTASSSSETELIIRARREVTLDSDMLMIEIPRPQSSALSPALVAIVPQDNIDLTPLEDDMHGLSPEATPPQWDLPTTQQQPLFYRKQADIDDPAFIGNIQVLTREVTAALDSTVRIDPQLAQIEQRFAYRIAYESLASLEIDVPRAALEAGGLQVLLGDVPLTTTMVTPRQTDPEPPGPPEPAPEQPGSPDEEASSLTPENKGDDGDDEASARRRLSVDLPADKRLGDVELLLRYQLRLPTLKEEEKVTLSVPLAMPTIDQQTSVKKNDLRITFAENLEVEAGQGHWIKASEDNPATNGSRSLAVSAEGAVERLPLEVALLPSDQPQATLVRQAWLQTWLTHQQRRDRAVFRLSGGNDRVRVQLPSGAMANELDVALDGRRVEDFILSETNQLVLELPTPRQQHVLELWYVFSKNRPAAGALDLETPYIVGASGTRRWYWQLVLPQDEHLVVSPDKLTSELTWSWQGLYWGRRASLGQSDLEKWIGASNQAELPEGTNRYLFSSIGSIQRASLVTAPRRWLLLAASLAALLIGLLLIYIPALRNPGVLFAAAVVLLGFGLVYPEPALQAAQAASVGIVLVLFARLVDWSISRRYSTRSVVRGTSLTHVELSPSDSKHPSAANISQLSTATAPHYMPPADPSS